MIIYYDVCYYDCMTSGVLEREGENNRISCRMGK